MSGHLEKIQDPELGEIYRAICPDCGKIVQSHSKKQTLFNIVIHQGTHNGHS